MTPYLQIQYFTRVTVVTQGLAFWAGIKIMPHLNAGRYKNMKTEVCNFPTSAHVNVYILPYKMHMPLSLMAR